MKNFLLMFIAGVVFYTIIVSIVVSTVVSNPWYLIFALALITAILVPRMINLLTRIEQIEEKIEKLQNEKDLPTDI